MVNIYQSPPFDTGPYRHVVQTQREVLHKLAESVRRSRQGHTAHTKNVLRGDQGGVISLCSGAQLALY